MIELTFSEFLYTIGLLIKEVKSYLIGGEVEHKYSYKFNEFALYFDDNVKKYFKWSDKYAVADNLNKIIDSLQKDDYRSIRLSLGLYNGTVSRQNFIRTKVIARLDTDIKDMELEEFLLKLEMFGDFQPNVIHKTYKGWHAFWLGDDWFEKEDELLIDNFVSFLDSIRVKNNALWIDKIDGIGAMTRIVCKDLPAYIIKKDTYSKSTLNELKIDKKYTEYTYILPTAVEFEDVFTQCQVIQILDRLWETHDYHQWFTMAWLYAVRYSLTGNEEVKKAFVSNSLLWRKNKPDLNKITSQFEYAKNFATKQEGILILPSCQWLYINGICEKCPVFRRNKNGEITSHPFRDADRFKIEVPGYIMEGGKWYAIESIENKETGQTIERKVELSKAFKIVKLIRKIMPADVEDYLKILTNNKFYIVERHNKTNGELDLSNIANIIPIKDKQRFRKFIDNYLYILQSDQTSMIEIDFVGYRKIANKQVWDIMIGNENVSEQELYSVLYGYFARDENVLIDYLPSTKGNYEEWKKAYIRLFELKEPLTLYLIGFFLSHFLLDWYREEYGALTPIVAIRGESRIGKTKRTLMALALFGKPKEFSFSSITEARVKNQFGIIKTPLFIDEVVSKGNDYEKMRTLIYHMANASVKADAYKTAPPITVPVVLAGEPNNFALEKAFNESSGLIRRVFTLLLKREEHLEDVWNEIDNVIFPTLNKNYGFIIKHLSAFQRNDLKQEYDKLNAFVKRVFNHFIDTLYAEHITHLTLSFMAFKFFYQDLGMSDKAIQENIELIASYLLTKADLIKDLVITNTTFEDICIEASNKFVEAMQNKKQFQAYMLTKALNSASITLQALDSNEKKLFNLVFGKYYKNRSFGFVKTAILDPLYKEEDLDSLKHNKEMCKLEDWQEFVEVYKQLLHRKYDSKIATSICNFFANGGLPEFRVKKKEDETDAEPEIDF